jgi:hypothetical protein
MKRVHRSPTWCEKLLLTKPPLFITVIPAKAGMTVMGNFRRGQFIKLVLKAVGP